MSVIKSAVIAFAMYSKIPMPQFAWEKKDMKYVILFFPWVGIVIGALFFGWANLCVKFQVGTMAYALIAAAIPVIISGGIHVDGFMDTMDAFHSYQEREKKLEILKDAHIGAFSVICLAVFGMIYVAAVSEARQMQSVALLAAGFYLSRILSGIAVVSFRCAKQDGLLYLFSSRAHEKIVKLFLYVQLILCIVVMFLISPVSGLLLVAGALFTFAYYHHRAYRELGGITGDTAGYFVVLCEGMMAVLAAICTYL